MADILNNAIEEILSELKTINNIDVFESIVDEEEKVIIDDRGMFKPYLVITFSGTSKMPKRFRSMTGARESGSMVSIVTRVVAPSPSIGRTVDAQVYDKLLGFTPTGCGEISPALYYSTGRNDIKGSPFRYSEVQSYEMVVS